MDDFHTANIIADGTTVSGFIDLEITRNGNEVLQLGGALSQMAGQPNNWQSFRCGYERGRGGPLNEPLVSLVRTTAPFTMRIRFSWYWTTDALSDWAVRKRVREVAIKDIAETVVRVEAMEL